VGAEYVLVWFLPLFLLIGLPVFFGLLAAPGLLLWIAGQERDVVLFYQSLQNGMDSFPLIAMPVFMLAGELMNRCGITMRLVEFSQAMMEHLRGGLHADRDRRSRRALRADHRAFRDSHAEVVGPARCVHARRHHLGRGDAALQRGNGFQDGRFS
jgi:hypothetical protein